MRVVDRAREAVRRLHHPRVTGERTFLTPVLGPIERAIYLVCGVDRRAEQHWITNAVSMLAFSVAGFLSACTRCSGAGGAAVNPTRASTPVAPDLAFNTAVSFVTTPTGSPTCPRAR